eukprot:TRINITY_DN16716_c0_g1_i1.p1 TRINITY_DN16716_c0_g1~~TRINITY_DN16716_c0_g1_i1.p1  ORF type:complete len:112 (-),score=4.65 TRINITY_DN16716_c0_g1_i1:177-512(-)
MILCTMRLIVLCMMAVTLLVAGDITINPTSLHFFGPQGGPPQSQRILINDKDVTKSYRYVSSNIPPWISAPSSGTVSPSDRFITIEVSLDGFVQGSYSDQMYFSMYISNIV